MVHLLYLYDCVNSRKSNARRVSFTKELYGFTYSWKTKSGPKERKKSGLIDVCVGATAVSDSAILVPEEYRGLFDQLFNAYRDILNIRIFEINQELEL